jgi:hypothetical protein
MTIGWRCYVCNFGLFHEASRWSLLASKTRVINEKELERQREKKFWHDLKCYPDLALDWERTTILFRTVSVRHEIIRPSRLV